MDNTNKQITHISWLFSALKEQYRFAFIDIREALKNPYFNSLPAMKKFLYHYQLSLTLFKQAEKTYVMEVRSMRFNFGQLQKIYSIYLQREAVQFQNAAEVFCNEIYSAELTQDPYYKAIKTKLNNQNLLLQQLLQLFDNLLKMIK